MDISDDPAVEAAYATLRVDLERAVRKVCPPSLAARADDFVQAALLKVMAVEEARAADSTGIDPSGGSDAGNGTRSSSYLYRVAYSVVVDELRRAKRRSEVPLEDPSEEGDASMREYEADTPTPERFSENSQIVRAVNDCLARLHQNRRRAVTLYLLGHTVPEASRLMQANLKRTESLVYRGLADLRRCLSSKGVEP